MSSTLEIKYIS